MEKVEAEHARESPASWWWQLVRAALRDWRVRIFGLIFLSTLGLGLFLPGSRAFERLSRDFLPLVVFPVLLWALAGGLGKLRSRAERKLWGDMLIAYGAWGLVTVLFFVFPHEDSTVELELFTDFAYLVFYISLVRATERRPELEHGATLAASPQPLDETSFPWPATTILVAVLLLYFQYLPLLLDLEAHSNLRLSFLFYYVLDTLIFVRFAALSYLSPSWRWRILYGGLAASSFAQLGSDLVEGLFRSSLDTSLWSTPLGLIWLIPLFLLTAVAAIRDSEILRARAPLRTSGSRPGSNSWRTVVSGFVLPVIHFGFYGFDLLTETTKAIRSAFVFNWLVIAGGIAVWQSMVQRRRHLSLLAGRDRLNETLGQQRREQLEKERLIAELEARNDEMDRFVYTVSHDLKTPLFTIEGFAGSIERDLENDKPERARQDLERIQSAADKMKHLLDDLLALSRVGRVVSPPEDVDLAMVVDEATDMVAGPLAESGTELVVERPLPTVHCDRRRMVEVFQNLLSNAVKFSRGHSDPRIEVTAEERGGQVLCRVRDNGVGIAPEYHERVFMLFERLDPTIEGTGLGLALVRRIVEVHGGRIWVESAGLGHGTSICLTLPRVEGGSR